MIEPSKPSPIASRWRRLKPSTPRRGGGIPDSPEDTPTRIPFWVAALDILTVLAVLLALRVLVGRGIKIQVAEDIRLSLNSVVRPLVAALGLWLVRHWLFRARPLHRRLLDRFGPVWRSPAVRAAWPPFLASRLAVLVVGYVAVVAIGFNPAAPWRVSNNELLNLPARWDSGWYLTVVSRGYAWDGNPLHESTFAFFPGLPALMSVGSMVTGLSEPQAGFVVVLAAFLWALTYFYRLAREHLNESATQTALLLAAFYPFAVYYCAVYTESVFLLAALGAFWHFRRGQLWRCACFCLLAGLIRPNGFLLGGVLGLIALMDFAKHRGWLRGRAAGETTGSWSELSVRLGVASLPIVAMLGYCAFVYARTGDPFVWMKVQQAWGRNANGLLSLFGNRQELIATYGTYSYVRNYSVEMLEGAAALFALAAAWPITKRFGLPYGVFVVINVLPSLYTIGTTSIGRYTAPLFPIFFWLGATVPESRRPYWLAAFAAGQALVAALFFTWRPPY